MKDTKRLDSLLVEKGLAPGRDRAKALIMTGRVLVDNTPADKPGRPVSATSEIKIKGGDIRHVSRGGIKLEAALKNFCVDARGRTCLDVGASTGGFTDCLLQKGAKHVFAVDVGFGQLAWKLRCDPRVTVIERTNIRKMEANALPRGTVIDLAVMDVSFISLRLAIPASLKFLNENSDIVALIKPQFEVGKDRVGKGGVVRDPALHREVIEDLVSFFEKKGLKSLGVTPSPITGPKGNREFFIFLSLR